MKNFDRSMPGLCNIEKKDQNNVPTQNIISSPFEYEIIDNFLSEIDLKEISSIYDSLLFKEIHTDLFRFMQSSEITKDTRLNFIKKNLNRIFGEKVELKDSYYNIFASFYRKGDFLLCHDDMVDERAYAFTFYLEDFESGKLILYENDCISVHRRIDVKKNRLVIFEVKNKSFHEVDLCLEDGRKAISGWISTKGKKQDSLRKHRSFSIQSPVEFFDLGINITNDEFVIFEFSDILTKEISRSYQAPFVDKRCIAVTFEKVYALIFEGYKLVHLECSIIEESGYILCNDLINSENENILDVFIFKCAKNIPDYLIYVNQSSDISFTVDALDGHMFIGKRLGHNICVHRAKDEVFLKHFIYQKI